jgi:hypothetical protein
VHVRAYDRRHAIDLMGQNVDLVTGTKVRPEPLAAPKRRSRGLSELTKNLIAPVRRAASSAAE